MKTADLNNYIKHYLEKDKTQSAIMLTGSWGSGKSYYIRNSLVPFLTRDKKNRCVIISLYGMKDLSEISRSIYFELRMKPLQSKNEAFVFGKGVAKTVAKGVTSFFGVDISTSEEERRELYESVDLSDKLVIFEDVERSKIDILGLLGYINNLVEQDGVKVLIVASESHMLKYNYSEPDEKGKIHKTPTTQTTEYLLAKEKTVSDTIAFEGDYSEALDNIIKGFENSILDHFRSPEYLNAIQFVFHISSSYINLRTFIFACQKACDIYEKLQESYEFEYLECIFFGIISLSIRLKGGVLPKWEGTDYLSTSLSESAHPLYRFCYDYIERQTFDPSKVVPTFEEHKKFLLYSREGTSHHDVDIDIIDSFHIHTEEEVKSALNNIEQRLSNQDSIPFYAYGKLIARLIILNSVLGYDYTICKERMINNIKGKRGLIDGKLLFLAVSDGLNPSQQQQFNSFKADILEALDYLPSNGIEFNYSPDAISDFLQSVSRNVEKIQASREFISKLDQSKLIEMLAHCNPQEIELFRRTLFAVYRYATKDSFIKADVQAMSHLASHIKEHITALSTDKIAQYQLGFLADNLDKFVSQIS